MFQQGASKLFTPITKVQEDTTSKLSKGQDENTNKILANLTANQDSFSKHLLALQSKPMATPQMATPQMATPQMATPQMAMPQMIESQVSQASSGPERIKLGWKLPKSYDYLKVYKNNKQTADMFFDQSFQTIDIYKMNKSNYVFNEYTLNKLKPSSDEIEKKYTVNGNILELLFIPNPFKTNSRITKSDIEIYFQIRDESGYAKPIKISEKTHLTESKYKEFDQLEVTGDGLCKQENPQESICFLPSDPKQLVSRLLVLLGSNVAGNNNVRNEAFAIMDMLLKQNKLSKPLYTKIVNEFFV